MSAPGFRITSGKGFHITFANGWTVSVQFGGGNYCDNKDCTIGDGDVLAGRAGCANAEIAAWPASGKMIEWPQSDDSVRGWVTPDELAAVILDISARPAGEEAA